MMSIILNGEAQVNDYFDTIKSREKMRTTTATSLMMMKTMTMTVMMKTMTMTVMMTTMTIKVIIGKMLKALLQRREVV